MITEFYLVLFRFLFTYKLIKDFGNKSLMKCTPKKIFWSFPHIIKTLEFPRKIFG